MSFNWVRDLAGQYMGGMGDRWAHVSAAGARAEQLYTAGLIEHDIVSAVWLHDIGYSSTLAVTGFHPLDGAAFLGQSGLPDRVVALVAAHTGARYEAAERGLSAAWSRLPRPDVDDLEVVTLIDLVTGPTGEPTDPQARLAEVLRRYPTAHPVHRAVAHSAPSLLAGAARALDRLRLPQGWPSHPESAGPP